MKLIIDISKTFKELADADDFKTLNSPVWYAIIIDCVKNGTVIPDKYGRLIDADELVKYLRSNELDSDKSIEKLIKKAPTVAPKSKRSEW